MIKMYNFTLLSCIIINYLLFINVLQTVVPDVVIVNFVLKSQDCISFNIIVYPRLYDISYIEFS